MIAPTIGRIIWYWPKGEPKPAAPNRPAAEQPQMGTICFVHSDRLVNIAGFDHLGAPYAVTKIALLQEGDSPMAGPHVGWMPYQVGQAKAAAPAPTDQPSKPHLVKEPSHVR